MPVASDQGGGNFTPPPAGNHLAICVHVIDLGTQKDSYLGQPKIVRKVRLSFELPEEKAVFDETKGEESFMVSKEYTLSLSEKANLRHDIHSWRGVDFTEEELKAFELSRLLGAPCMVNVVHKVSATKRTYAAITSIVRLPKNVKKAGVPKPTIELLSYNIEDGINDVYKKLPKFIQDKIATSLEATGEIDATKGAGDGKSAPDGDDDIPF